MRRTGLLLSVIALLLASCGGGTEEGQDTQTTKPSASASGSTEASIGGVTVADLQRTWIGPLVEPGRRATYSVRATIRQCSPGQECGHLKRICQECSDLTAAERQTCEASLTYKGIEGNVFMFQEATESGTCADAELAVVPMPDAYSIGVQEYREGTWETFGSLLNSIHYFGYP